MLKNSIIHTTVPIDIQIINKQILVSIRQFVSTMLILKKNKFKYMAL